MEGTIMTISKDRVKPSPQHDSWKLAEIFVTGVILGGYLAMMTVIFFWAAYKTNFFPIGVLIEDKEFVDSCMRGKPWKAGKFYSSLHVTLWSEHLRLPGGEIEQLQLRLQQEKSMRMMLERAMGRASSTLSPGHRHFAAQVQEMLPTMNKTSVLRSLKDHLHQCPSKLSEEMVRCMAAVYCWLGSSVSANPTTLKRSGISEDRDWSCKSMVEISSISTDKNHFSRASYAINNYRVLVEQLEKVNVAQMETNAKIAFWVNTYNSLVMHVKIDNWYGLLQIIVIAVVM